MPELEDKIVVVISAISGVVSFAFYRLYRSRSETARQVECIPLWQADKDLHEHLTTLEKESLDYVAVEGVIKETGRALQSRYGKAKGVLSQLSTIAYKARRSGGLWTETKEPIEDDLQSVPFCLYNPADSSSDGQIYRIDVSEPKEASQIIDDMEITYHNYEPNKSNFLKETFDRLYGEVTKGVKVTERMLLCGSTVTGLGRVYLDKGHTKIGPPADSKHPYILTTMSLSELVKRYKSQSVTFKVLSVITAFISGGLLLSLLWRCIRRWYLIRKQRKEFEELRRAHAKMKGEAANTSETGESTNGSDSGHSSTCVICLVNERQVIALNCGHVALCADCAEALPYPKKCPVCRAKIVRLHPVFNV